MELKINNDLVPIYKGQKPFDIVEQLKQKYNLNSRAQLRLFEKIVNS